MKAIIVFCWTVFAIFQLLIFVESGYLINLAAAILAVANVFVWAVLFDA